MIDIFLIIVLVITIAFWIDLILPDPIPFIDEVILFIMMIGGWILYSIYKVTTEGLKIVTLIFSPAGFLVLIVIIISFLIWKFNLLGDPIKKGNRRK